MHERCSTRRSSWVMARSASIETSCTTSARSAATRPLGLAAMFADALLAAAEVLCRTRTKPSGQPWREGPAARGREAHRLGAQLHRRLRVVPRPRRRDRLRPAGERQLPQCGAPVRVDLHLATGPADAGAGRPPEPVIPLIEEAASYTSPYDAISVATGGMPGHPRRPRGRSRGGRARRRGPPGSRRDPPARGSARTSVLAQRGAPGGRRPGAGTPDARGSVRSMYRAQGDPQLRRRDRAADSPSSMRVVTGRDRETDSYRRLRRVRRTAPGRREVLSRVRHAGVLRPRTRDASTVTLLFSDVTGSTAMGEELDPEVLPRRDGPVLRGRARRSSGMAGRSRSSSATRSWPSSGFPRRTRTTRCGPFAQPVSSARSRSSPTARRRAGPRLRSAPA